MPKPTFTLFELTILNCMYERVSSLFLRTRGGSDWRQKYQRSHAQATPEDLERLKSGGTDDPSLEGQLADLSLKPAEDPFKDVPVLSHTPAELYLFDTEADVFVSQEKQVHVDIAANAEYDSEPAYTFQLADTKYQPGSPFGNNRFRSFRCPSTLR